MRYFFLVIGLAFCTTLSGQLGDECLYPRFISDVNDYCSGEREFSIVEATPSLQDLPSCWPPNSASNDVWFAFVPQKLAVYISVKGAAQFSEGTLENPSIAIYSGNCNDLNQIACSSDLFDDHLVELTLDDTNIGQVYYIRVDARNENVGSFQLCIKEFNPARAPEADCRDAVLLCDKSSFYVENLIGHGEVFNEVSGSCVQEELSSVWYKWICDEAGTLEFDITPNNISDDIDFVVYHLPDGIDVCKNKEVLRCMASGETIGAGQIENYPCAGVTGMRESSSDTQEFPGCAAGDDNYISSFDMVPGEAYVLMVNNYSKSGYGFSIDFGGTGTFKGPEADFEVTPLENDFECDKEIKFDNLSQSLTDPITSYSWNFGEGSEPSFYLGENPPNVTYNSFGDKVAAITVETSRGCFITYVEEFFVEPCCKDTNTLELQIPDILDVSCYDYADGQIILDGIGGSPAYRYYINDNPIQPIPVFSSLDAGIYEVGVVDIKGCEDVTTVEIIEPPKIVPDAGRDTTVNLGDIIMIDGSVTPLDNYNYSWNPDSLFSCYNCLDPEFYPLNSQLYVLTATDENGCFGRDTISIRVEIIREIDGPNIISPDGTTSNAKFNLVGNKATVGIEELLIYDRWGNLVYKGAPQLGDFSIGWDGTFDGEPVENGVYTWLAKVLFLDGMVVPFSGDITVIR